MAGVKLALAALLAAQLLLGAAGDVYINNPRGSNNKLNEETNNRNNANRLFDSENNGAGGYQVGDNCDGICHDENNRYDKDLPGAGEGTMYYYPESVLYIEWTNQHAAGLENINPNAHSEVVIQYMCEDDEQRTDSSGEEISPWLDRFQTGIWSHTASDSFGIRDGRTTNTIPDDVDEYNDPEFGMHESWGYYQDCKVRERNKGLWNADKTLNNDRGATATRQNPNGNAGNNRQGFECPEERDYYPYWHPTPWKDIAVLTSDLSRCRYYSEKSENVEGRNYCVDPEANNQEMCIDPPFSSRWEFRKSHDLPPPECQKVPFTRDNHHGNSADGSSPNYNWTLPRAEDLFRGVSEDVQELKCVLRVRYNITSGEGYTDGWFGADAMGHGVEFVDKRFNEGNSPVKNDPLDDWVGLGHNVSGPLRLALNTAQTGRTFEDRTHMFKVRRRPKELEGKKIYNLNVRGRRGNIVQVYPSVEYDFAPTQLQVYQGDYIHYQWTGSDANANNDGEGRQRTDRNNLVQHSSQDSNIPGKVFFFNEFGEEDYSDDGLFIGSDGKPNATVYAMMAFLNQTECDPCYFSPGNTCEDYGNRPTNNGNAQNDAHNCAVLNRAPAYFDGGVHQAKRTGTYRIMSTRNNNFSNRSEKGVIEVMSRNLVPVIVGSIIGGVSALMAGAAAVMIAVHAVAVKRAALATAAGAGGAAAGAAGSAGAAAGAGAAGGGAAVAGCGIFACCGSCCASIALFGADISDHWRRKSTAFKAFVYLVAFCIAISLAGFIRNSDKLTFARSMFFSLAKAGGYLLDFSMTLILFPMMRNLVSWLRTTPITEVIPLDDNHSLHILVAKIIAVGVVMHVVGHYLTMDWSGANIPLVAFGTLPGATGHLVLICMFFMYVTSMMRKGVKLFGRFKMGSFDTFWLTHKLYILVYLLLIFHAEAFYKWLFWPMLLYICDKAIHYLRGKKQCELFCVRQEAKGTDVMSLQMRVFLDGRLRFRYRCGQYLMLQCPALGKEWHPFTITSAPEEDFVSVHIRCRGDWTKALQKQFNPDSLQEVRYRPIGSAEGDSEDNKYAGLPEQPVDIKVDGPYGSGSDRTDEYNTVMLVGTGIGVTPFASVMKSLKIRQQREGSAKPTKVYFYWVCRDQKEFDWFSWLIEELSHLGDRFELNTYLTGELDLDKMIKQHVGGQGLEKEEKAALIKAGKTNSVKKNQVASGDGTEAVEMKPEAGTKWAGKKWAGRPDWRRIFKEKSGTHAGEEIGVFLCGPGAAELQAMCEKNTTAETAFVFHKEVF